MGLGAWLLRAAYGVGGIAGLGITLLYFLQEKILYVPRIPGISPHFYTITPDRYKLQYEDAWVTSEDGTKLHAWLLWGQTWDDAYRASRPVIMFFQENAGPMTFRLPFLRLLVDRTHCNVFALSYRGYGHSSGSPSEKGLQADARAALDHVCSRKDVDARRVLVFGRSLGGAVALHLAAGDQANRVSAIMIENAFSSVEAMVPQVLPPLKYIIGPGKPLNFLVRNKWYNTKAIASPKLRRTPMLLMVSLLDEMVPPPQMFQLYDAAADAHGNDNIQMVQFPDAHHMDAYDTCAGPYWQSLVGFMQAVLAGMSEDAGRGGPTSTAAAGDGVAAAVAAQYLVQQPHLMHPLDQGALVDGGNASAQYHAPHAQVMAGVDGILKQE